MSKNILGTVQGSGYDCRKEKGDGDINRVEGSTNGVWNKVSEHVAWIRKTAEDLGEIFCDDQNGEESDKAEEEVNGKDSQENKSDKDSEEKKSEKEDDEKKSGSGSEGKDDKDSEEKKIETESEEKKSDKED